MDAATYLKGRPKRIGPVLIYRAFRTRGVYANYDAFRDQIALGMTRDVFPLVGRAMSARVENWKHKPNFSPEHWVSEKGIFLEAIPVGPNAKYWEWVSGGVKGHWITVKNRPTRSGKKGYKPKLRMYKYTPKTTVGGGYGGPGTYQPPARFATRVWWPGIEPRDFESYIVEEVKPDFRRFMENAARRGVRRMQREGF